MTWEAFLAFKILETSTRDAFKRAPGGLLAGTSPPRVSQEGSGERFRSVREASWGQETPNSSPGGLLAANLAPQKCPKRGLGSILATNFAPKGVPIGAWGAFFKRQGGVLALRNAQELLWWPSGRELGPQECPRRGLGSVLDTSGRRLGAKKGPRATYNPSRPHFGTS